MRYMAALSDIKLFYGEKSFKPECDKSFMRGCNDALRETVVAWDRRTDRHLLALSCVPLSCKSKRKSLVGQTSNQATRVCAFTSCIARDSSYEDYNMCIIKNS